METAATYVNLTPKKLKQTIHQLETYMHHAQSLEFEKAASVRDQIHTLRESVSPYPEIRVGSNAI